MTIEDKIKQAVADIIKSKEERRIEPTHALSIEVYKKIPDCKAEDIKSGLNSLFLKNEIEVGNTANHKWIRLKA